MIKCFNCSYTSSSPFHYPCPSCRISLDHLDRTTESGPQRSKWDEHLDLIYGRSISLYGKDCNCSYDSIGYAKIRHIVEFTAHYGQKLRLPANRGPHINDVLVAFIPEIIGSGISNHYPTLDNHPSSGCCIISPLSITYGHSFPVLYDWIIQKWPSTTYLCKKCNKPTHIGLPFCSECYSKYGGDWTKFLDRAP